MATKTLCVVLGLLSGAVAQWERLSGIPPRSPLPPADYMVDNQNNYFKTAPDKGGQNGAVWLESGSFENFVANSTLQQLRNGTGYLNTTSSRISNIKSLKYDRNGRRSKALPGQPRAQAAASGYWLPQLAPLGKQPLAGPEYKFFRNVVDDYGADNSGDSDTSEALNAAIEDGNRCGMECGNTFSQGAIIYFPPGTYKICRPVIQLYYTQFIGDALDPPTIKGCDEFQGIALFDTDPYIPGGNGQNWYINQNQFFRQIRNFIFDLTEMPSATDDNDQALVPTGLHWQVSQACSLQNLVFNMPDPDGENVTHVGIFMENGSGGFVSDLEFNGGNIGWRAGSQQYTAMNLKFRRCLTAVQMVWDWGFNWQRVDIEGSFIGFNISGRGGDTGQGIGSVSIIDSRISNCPIGIFTNGKSDAINGVPNIVLDNVELSGVATTIVDDSGKTILGSIDKVELWAMGRRYNGSYGEYSSGAVDAPPKGSRLLDDKGKLFYRPRPQYENLGQEHFLVATENGCKNDGTGDNTDAINAFLLNARNARKIAYFPAGIYRVGGTVVIPTGSRVQGASWSQIQGGGFYFNDIFNPKVVVQVGNRGDVGTMEIVDMMFNVQGATAGAIVLEWNVHESSQGSAAMWDSHVRVGGATGSSLDIDECPRFGYNDNCICASLLFHVTPQSSGYFENVWIWLADHDNDMSVYDSPDKVANQISLYAARGTLIESSGPSWFYGTGSEHTVLYQYQLYGAKDIYLGHMQSETPYYQPVPVAPIPFDVGKKFPGDPSFAQCSSEGCKEAWGLRVINSESVTIHGAGMYSFFQEYYQDCLETHNCQERICEVKGSKDVAIFNLFTVGVVEIATGINGGGIYQNDSNQSGFTTEVSVWLPLDGDDDKNIVYVGPEVFTEPSVTCSPPCVLVFPTSSLASSSTIDPGNYTTSLEYGSSGTTINSNGVVITTFFTTTTTVTIDIPEITIGGIPYYNVNVTSGQITDTIVLTPSVDIPPIGVPVSDGEGGTTTRTLTLPPWPAVSNGPPDAPGWGNPVGPWVGPSDSTVSGVFRTPFRTTISASGPTVTTLTFPSTVSPMVVSCPPVTTIAFNTPKTTITTDCNSHTAWTIAFTCPATKIVTFLGPSAGVFTADCTLATIFNPPTGLPEPEPSTTKKSTTTTLPIWNTWPGGVITPVTTTVEAPKATGNGVVTPCKLWFFSFCISTDGFHIGGWFWNLPPGIYPPGPPPDFIEFPKDWTVKGALPPWPKITVGPNKQITYSSEPTICETRTALVCSTTTLSSETISFGTTVTSVSSSSRCETIRGCSVTDSQLTTRVECALPTPASLNQDGDLERRQDPPPQVGCPANAIVYPTDPENTGNIPALLQGYAGKYKEIKSSQAGFTSFFWVPLLDQGTMDKLKQSPDVGFAYYYEEYNANAGADDDPEDEMQGTIDEIHWSTPKENILSVKNDTFETKDSAPFLQQLETRAAATPSRSKYWPLSQISLPRGKVWMMPDSGSFEAPDFLYRYDEAAGEEQYVYMIFEQVHMAPQFATSGISKAKEVKENVLLQLQDALDDILEKQRVGKAVINMSFSSKGQVDWYYERMRYILSKLEIRAKAVLVCSSNNHAKEIPNIDRHPALFGEPGARHGQLLNLITVGSTDIDTYEGDSSQYADWMTTFAPAHNAWIATGDANYFRKTRGTSFAAPQVAALAAYLRSLPSPWKTQLQEPRHVKKMIRLLHRRFTLRYPSSVPNPSLRKPIIWNGQVGDKNCLVDYDTRSQWDTDNACPEIDKDLDKEMGQGETVEPCGAGIGENSRIAARQDGGFCPVLPGNGGWGDGGGQTVSFTSGSQPSPTCASGTGCGGHVCTGYWCNPSPTGVQPDYQDPKDPNAGRPVPTTIIPGPTDPNPEPEPEPTREPIPEPNPHPEVKAFIIIALAESVFVGEPNTIWYREWLVYAAEPDGFVTLCRDRPVFWKSAPGATGADPGFPSVLGPFDAKGFQCNYNGNGDSLVGLDCSDIQRTVCTDNVEDDVVFCGGPGNPSMRAVALCSIYQ
ncbi:putative 1,3-beta glucanase [Colletotrichum sublineola]|uniref:Putative 1,3-beta glucanase n=1 Tax=Colletotrichum sublineola TaxID=1173701 RepID=A0A066XI32_COLSU|nr:putative 1,3-beta glucanase [Colletotrichum sublineola]